MLGKIAADSTLKYFSYFFPRKQDLTLLAIANETILFAGKNKKKF